MMQRTFYLITETEPQSGKFELQPASVVAASSSAAITALKDAAGEARYGVWPYRYMAGDPPAEAPTEDEAGHSYQLLEQTNGASGPFVLSDTTVVSETADASAAAISMGIDVGYRVGLLLSASTSTSTTSTASTADSSTSGASTSSASSPSSDPTDEHAS